MIKINRRIASARKYSLLQPFVGSVRLSLHWIWISYTTFHTFCNWKKILIVCQKRMNEFQTLCIGFKVVGIKKVCYVVPRWLNIIGFNFVDLCSKLIPVWVYNIECRPMLQRTSLKISFVHTRNGMGQVLFCCIAVIQYVSIICQCGASANDAATCRIV